MQTVLIYTFVSFLSHLQIVSVIYSDLKFCIQSNRILCFFLVQSLKNWTCSNINEDLS